MDSTIIIAILSGIGGALISSLVSPYILKSSERRTTRAKALEKLYEIESRRWSDTTYTDMRILAAEFRAAILISGGSRPLSEMYLVAALIAWRFSDSGEPAPDTNAGGIPMDVSNLATKFAREVADSIWHPWVSRLLFNRLRKMTQEYKALEDKYKNKPEKSHFRYIEL